LTRDESPAQAISLTEILAVAVILGVLGGLLEGASHFVRARFLATNLPLGAYMVWMPAAANLAFFLGLAVLVVLVRMLVPQWLSPPRVVGLFTALAGMAALRAFDNYVSILTVDLVAIGIAVQAARWAGPRWEAMRNRLPTVAGLMIAIVVALAAGLQSRYLLAEHRALAALPAPAPGRPNVLLLVLDTVRRFNLSSYGYPRATAPGFTALAERGVLFEDAVSTAPWTLPSHASIMTGRWAHEMSASWSIPLDDRDSTLAEALASRGYRTAGFVANISYAGRSSGIARGFSHYDGVRLTATQIARSAAFTSWLSSRHWTRRLFRPFYKSMDRKTAAEVDAAFLDWLDRGEPRPFFAFLNYFDAHDPYLPQAPFDTAFTDPGYPALPPPAHPGGHHDATPRSQREYDQAIAYLDHEIGNLLRALDQRGLLANTLVIVTSDHGEEFGEHGMYGHGHTLYLPGLAVPLIMALPEAVPSGVRLAGFVSLRDLPATVMDLTVGEQGSPFPGGSLARFWRDRSNAADTLLTETRYARGRPDWDATSRGDLQGALYSWQSFLRDASKRPELYDLRRDPGQTNNLAASTEADSTIPLLQAFLDRRMGAPSGSP
jgi:arylsulfatase A-like enzyme